MKRAFAFVAAMALAFALVPSVGAAPIGVTKAADLFAGQTADVGDVFVWNDATKLYVELDLAAGWCMTESHVAVASALAGIPQTKTFNPIPGKFAAGDSYDPCQDADTFEFALSGFDATPVIAVHAMVWEMTTSRVSIVSNPGSTNRVAYAETYPVFGAPVDAVVPTFAGSGTWPALAGASYISDRLAGDLFNVNRWRKVTETLTVPGWPVSGQFWVNSDNYEFTTIDGVEVQRDDDGPTSTVEGVAVEPLGGGVQTWTTIDHVAFTPNMGPSVFGFVFRNVIWEGCCGFVDNPTGLIYKAEATYYAHSESAWAGTAVGVSAFPGANWATYFGYGVQSYVVGDTVATTPFGSVDLDFEVWGGPPPFGRTSWARTTGFVNLWEGPVVSATTGSTTASFTVRVASGTPIGIDLCDITIAVTEGGAGVGTWNITSVVNSPSEICPFTGQIQGPYAITSGSIEVFAP